MREKIVSLDQVCLAYEKKITEPISLSVAAGEILVLAGESGSGKTSVLRAILGLPELRVEVVSGSISYFIGNCVAFPIKQKSAPRRSHCGGTEFVASRPSAGGESCGAGFYFYREKELTGMRERERQTLLGTEMTMIFQNPGAAFNPIRTYQKQLVDMLKSRRRYRGKQSLAEICSCLESLNLPDAERILASCPCELSGGMNQRMAIAAAMLLRPRLLLADEPTSALDVESQRLVVEELLRVRELTGMSMIVVTHNLRVAEKLADQIGILQEGKLIELGTAEQVLQHPQQPYTRELLAAAPQEIWNYRGGMA